MYPYQLLKVPPARRGNRTRARFPSRSGGNLKEGGQFINSEHAIGISKGRHRGLPLHRRLPSPARGRGVRGEGLAPRAEVEQHNQQIGIVNNQIAVHIRRVRTRRAEGEQHLQQVSVIHA